MANSSYGKLIPLIHKTLHSRGAEDRVLRQRKYRTTQTGAKAWGVGFDNSQDGLNGPQVPFVHGCVLPLLQVFLPDL